MSMSEANPENNKNSSLDNIEVLDDSSINANESVKNSENETVMPFLFDEQQPSINNVIEEVKDSKENEIVDPMDSVIKLDPNYEQIVEQSKGIDLKTAINEVRDMVRKMEKQGFKISLDEIDLNGNYQMTININND